MGTTGGGATIAFTSPGQAAVAAGRLVSISGLSFNGEAVEDADLASSVNKMMAGDLVTYSTIEVTIAFDASEFIAVTNYLAGTLTIVYPSDEDSQVLTVSGAAFVLGKTINEIANNGRLLQTYVFQPTGAWGLAAA